MTDRASSLSRLVLTVFRLNGGLLEAGDALVRDIGLTSARWQVLGASAEHGAPQTVSQIARTMGLTRQAVQRVADDLHRAGRSEEHTSELQSLMRISYAVFCLKKKKKIKIDKGTQTTE